MIDGIHAAHDLASDQVTTPASYPEVLGLHAQPAVPVGEGGPRPALALTGTRPMPLPLLGFEDRAPIPIGIDDAPGPGRNPSDRSARVRMAPQGLPSSWNASVADPNGNSFVLSR